MLQTLRCHPKDPGQNKVAKSGRRDTRLARREERADRESVSDEQRSRAGCIGALSKVLSEDGRWQSSLPSVILAEGLFQYLTDDEVRGLLRDAAACTSSGSRFAFSHAISGVRKLLSILLRLIGEPWKSAIRSEDLPEFVEGTGWTMTSDVDTDSAHGAERYAVAGRR